MDILSKNEYIYIYIYIYIYNIYKRYFNKTEWMHSFIKDKFFFGI